MTDEYNMHPTWKAQECSPKEMAEWIVSGWRESRGSDRVLVIAIEEALKVIPATVGDLEARMDKVCKELSSLLELDENGVIPEWRNVKRWVTKLLADIER